MYFGGPPHTGVTPWAPAIYAGVCTWTAMPRRREQRRRNDATIAAPAQQPAIVPGIAGNARSFDGRRRHAGRSRQRPARFGTASFSYSIWVNVVQSIGLYDTPLFKGGAAAVQAGYDYEPRTGAWTSHFADGTLTQSPTFGSEPTLLNRWSQLTVVIDRAAAKDIAYTNGAESARANLVVGSMSNALPLTFSRLTDPFHGLLDEVRISRIALTAPWIATEYANLTARDQFMTIGPAEAP